LHLDYASNVKLYPKFPEGEAAVAGDLGEERSVLFAAGSGSVQAG
jgi:hypothetical protein